MMDKEYYEYHIKITENIICAHRLLLFVTLEVFASGPNAEVYIRLFESR